MPTAAPETLAALQRSVALHLTAIEHYATLGEHQARWGYAKLGERWRADAEEERGHFRSVVARLEYYDEAAVLTHDAPAWPRHDIEGILAASLELETAAATVERAGILIARAAGDEESALVFAGLLAGSEESIQRLEADMKVIGQVGVDNWLANLT